MADILAEQDQITKLIHEMNARTVANNTERSLLVTKLKEAIEKTNIQGNAASPKLLEAQLQMLSTMDSLMSSQESSIDRTAKLVLKNKDINTTSKASEIIAKALSQINHDPGTASEVYNDPNADNEIDRIVAEECPPITEGERKLTAPKNYIPDDEKQEQKKD